MKKKLLLFAVLGTTIGLHAQYEGHVGINTETPTSTLHVKAKGNTATTQVLKVDNNAGINLLTINDDGSVSGTAAVNLSSGNVGAPKASGLFASNSAKTANGILSPVGNGFALFDGSIPILIPFQTVAQIVPFDAVLSALTVRFSVDSAVTLDQFCTVQLLINGTERGNPVRLQETILYPGFSYLSAPVTATVTIRRGDFIAYRLQNFPESRLVNCAVSMKYTER